MATPLKIAVFSENRRDVFSGGRYYVLHLAEALATAGHHVDYISNNVPVFLDEFQNSPGHRKLKVHITKDFVSGMPQEAYDAVVMTPSRSDNPPYYMAARLAAVSSGAQLVLVNFESANWFNHYAKIERDPAEWDHWRRVCVPGATVMSISAEGNKWAPDFYNQYPERTTFDFWRAPVNSIAADMAGDYSKENRALIISRLSDPHKGMNSILDLLPDGMEGWTLSVISGSGVLEPVFEHDLRQLCANRGLQLEIINRPSDQEKFEQLKKAKVLLFPSVFEGYGYPPIEALYCNTEVVAYDLPVLRETCEDMPHFAEHGNLDDFRQKLAEVIADPNSGTRDYQSRIADIAGMAPASQRANDVFTNLALPQNRTTMGTVPAVVEQGTEKSKGALHGLRHMMWTRAPKLSNRISRLKRGLSPSGIAKGLKRNTQRALVATGQLKLEERGGISEATTQELGVVVIRGWRLGAEKADRISIEIGGFLEAPAERDRRPDIAKKYPEYGQTHSGYALQIRYLERDLVGLPFDVVFYKGKRELIRQSGVLQKAPSSAVTWATRMRAPRRKLKGKNVVVVAHYDEVRIGKPRRNDLVNLLQGLNKGGYVPHLVLQGNPVELLVDPSELEAHCDELVIADETKHETIQETLAPGSRLANASREAVNQLKSQHVLAGLVAFGGSMAEALEADVPGTRKYLFLLSPENMLENGRSLEEAKSCLDHADTVLLPSEAVTSSSLLAGRDVLPLHLGPEAYGEQLPPSLPGSKTVLVPGLDLGAAAATVSQFAEDLIAAMPDVTLCVTGKTGREVEEYLALEHGEEHPVVQALTVVPEGEGLRAAYENAALVVSPYALFEGMRSEDQRQMLRASLGGVLQGRVVVARGQEQASACAGITPASWWGISWHEEPEDLVAEVVKLLSKRNVLEARELAAETSVRALRSDELSRQPLVQSLETIRIPFGRLEAMPEDTLAYRAAQSMCAASANLPASGRCKIVIGQSLSVADAVTGVLEHAGCEVEGLVSFEPEFAGNTFNHRIIEGPPTTDEHGDIVYVLATLDREEARAWAHRLHVGGARTAAIVPLIGDDERRALVSLRHSEDGGRLVLFGDPDKQAQLQKKSDGNVWLASDKYCLAHPKVTWLRKMDFVLFTDPAVTAAHWQRIATLAPKAKLIFFTPAPAFVGGPILGDRMIRLDPENLPWRHWTISATMQADAQVHMACKAAQLASWLGCSSMSVRGLTRKLVKQIHGVAEEHSVKVTQARIKASK